MPSDEKPPEGAIAPTPEELRDLSSPSPPAESTKPQPGPEKARTESDKPQPGPGKAGADGEKPLDAGPKPLEEKPKEAGPKPEEILAKTLADLPSKIAEGLRTRAVEAKPAGEPKAPDFKLWRPDGKFVERLYDPENAQTAIAEMADAVTNQTAVLVLNWIEQNLVQTTIEPLRRAVARGEGAAAETRYLSKYPDHKGWENEAKQIAQQLLSSNKTWDSEEAFFAEIAAGVNALRDRYSKLVARPAVAPPPPSPGASPRKPVPQAAPDEADIKAVLELAGQSVY